MQIGHSRIRLHDVIKRTDLGSKCSHLLVMQNLAIAAICMMTIFCGNEDIEVQRGSLWPRFTRKVSDGITARAEGSVCPLALGVYIRVPSGGAGAASGLLYPFFTALTATRWVGIICYPHCGDEPAEAQGRQRTCLRSCSRYAVRGLGARRELGQQDLFLCQSMFIAQSKRIFLRRLYLFVQTAIFC